MAGYVFPLLLLALSVSVGLSRRPPVSRESLLNLIQSPNGRPPHVADEVFDCAWRYYALSYAAEIQPWLTPTQLQLINDSLSFQSACKGSLGCYYINSFEPGVHVW